MRIPVSALIALALLGCRGNEAPSAPVVSITPDVPRTGDDIQAVIDVDSVDPEGEPVEVAFTWFVNGEPWEGSGSLVPAAATAKGQSWKVVATPTDGELEGQSAEAIVTIADTAPAVGAVQIAAAASGDLECSATDVSDADGDEVTLAWSWEINGAATADVGPILALASIFGGDVVTCTATPTDGTLEGDPVTSAEHVVGNTPPELDGATLTPDPVTTTQDLTCVPGATSDRDGDEVTLSFAWTIDGAPSAETSAVLGSAAFAKHEVVECVVTPRDGSTDGAPATASVVVSNTPPVLEAAGMSPSEPRTDTSILCVPGAASDADGDTITFAYAWTVDGAPVSDTKSALPSDATKKGDVVACTVTPSDGDVSGGAVSAGSVTVVNTPPVAATVAITPSVATTATELACEAVGTDADADDLTWTYAWAVNGAPAGAGGAQLAPSATKKGDSVVCTATPHDGTDEGAPLASATHFIVNAAPEIASASLSPEDPRTLDKVKAAVVASDPDGDPMTYTYAWTVNGSPVAATGDTLDGATWFAKGDSVEVEVTAKDARAESAPFTAAAVTVVNTAPGKPTVEIEPADPRTEDDLVCVIADDADDPDDDEIEYTFTWTRNGSPFTGADTTVLPGDTVANADTDTDDVFTCSALPNDGDEDGPSSDEAEAEVGGATVPGFSGHLGPTFSGWIQCEGYLDKPGGDDIPKEWGDDCTGVSFDRIKLVCGPNLSQYRYIDVKKNVFRLGLSAYSETGLITAFKDEAGTDIPVTTNIIYASGNHPHSGTSWWQNGNGCTETSLNISVNNSCSWEVSNCFGQNLPSDRYLWVYVAP